MSDKTVVHPDVTTAELWTDVEQVLRDKGASEEWLAYVMPDLHVATARYASACWAAGHASGSAGYVMPNPLAPEE